MDIVRKLKNDLQFYANDMADLIEGKSFYLSLKCSNKGIQDRPFAKWISNNFYYISIIEIVKFCIDGEQKDDKPFLSIIKTFKEKHQEIEKIRAKGKDTAIDIHKIFDRQKYVYNKDILKIANILARYRKYRNKKIAHFTDVNISQPKIKQILKDITSLERLFSKYNKMLGEFYALDNEKYIKSYSIRIKKIIRKPKIRNTETVYKLMKDISGRKE